MSTVKKVLNQKKHNDIIVVDKLKDYSNESFFLEKEEKARIAVSQIKWYFGARI